MPACSRGVDPWRHMRLFDTFARTTGFLEASDAERTARARWAIVLSFLLIIAAAVAAPLVSRQGLNDAQQCERVPGAFNSGFSAGFQTARCACPDRAQVSVETCR